ncbi:MAG: hypothetical protein LQ345_005385 [Seirophora villosa]|nr:MAG: hypothetical protein LQ345_005385 [Seirophora villosa]
MHLAVYLAFLSIGWAFHTAASPLIEDEGALLTPSRPAPPAILAREEHPRIRCEVPGSSTVLLILPGARSIIPVRYARLLEYTRLDIARKIGYGNPDRRLLVGEVPYICRAWGIELRVDPAPPPAGSHPSVIPLTWRILLDTVEGMVKCVLDKGIAVSVQADIITVRPGREVDFHGILFLERFFPPLEAQGEVAQQ